MATVTLDVPEELADRLAQAGDRLPELISFALDLAEISSDSAAAPVRPSPAWLEAIDFLSNQPSPQEIIDFKFSTTVQERLEALLSLQQSGTLPPEIQMESETLRLLNHLFIVLKARARASLAA